MTTERIFDGREEAEATARTTGARGDVDGERNSSHQVGPRPGAACLLGIYRIVRGLGVRGAVRPPAPILVAPGPGIMFPAPRFPGVPNSPVERCETAGQARTSDFRRYVDQSVRKGR